MKLLSLPITQIVVGAQHRKSFDGASLEQLTQSVREQGVLQPILVCQLDLGYHLVAGERRLRAARAAGHSEIPAYALELEGGQIALLSAMENFNRVGLNPLEEVEAVLVVCADFLRLPVEEVKAKLTTLRSKPMAEFSEPLQALFSALGLGNWKSFVVNRLPLLKMPSELKQAVAQGTLAYTKARKLSRVKDETARSDLLEQVVTDGISNLDLHKKVAAMAQKEKDPQAEDPVATAPETLRREFGALSRSNFEALTPVVRKRVRRMLREVADLIKAEQVAQSP